MLTPEERRGLRFVPYIITSTMIFVGLSAWYVATHDETVMARNAAIASPVLAVVVALALEHCVYVVRS